LTADQVTQGKQISLDIQKKYAKELAALTELKGDELRKKVAELRQQAGQDSEQQLAKLLKPAQRNRLKQINLQVLGVQAFGEANVQKALQINKDQLAALRSVVTAAGHDVSEALAAPGGNPAAVGK